MMNEQETLIMKAFLNSIQNALANKDTAAVKTYVESYSAFISTIGYRKELEEGT